MTDTPQAALERLKAGNRRFLADEAPLGERSHDRRMAVAREQRPFAALLGCSDSRVGPETLFGTGLGDLFIVRSAGNTIDELGLGSLEYAVSALEVPLIVVMGHERCGAIDAAYDAHISGVMPPGAIAAVVRPLLAAIADAAGGCVHSGTADDQTALLHRAARGSIARTVLALRASPEAVLSDAVRDGRLMVVGAYYALQSGAVEFFDVA